MYPCGFSVPGASAGNDTSKPEAFKPVAVHDSYMRLATEYILFFFLISMNISGPRTARPTNAPAVIYTLTFLKMRPAWSSSCRVFWDRTAGATTKTTGRLLQAARRELSGSAEIREGPAPCMLANMEVVEATRVTPVWRQIAPHQKNKTRYVGRGTKTAPRGAALVWQYSAFFDTIAWMCCMNSTQNKWGRGAFLAATAQHWPEGIWIAPRALSTNKTFSPTTLLGSETGEKA